MSIGFEITVSIFLILGGLFVFVGSIGLLRLPDIYTRLHAPTKATTLGLGGLLFASMIYFYAVEGSMSINELLITLFLVITAPVTAHILAKVAMHHYSHSVERTKNRKLVDKARDQKNPKED